MNNKKRVIKCVMFPVMLLMTLLISAFSAHAQTSKEVKKADIVLVIDTSGSMKSSDPDRLVLEAFQTFMQNAPTEGNRVAVVGFNTDAHIYTQSGDKPSFLELDDRENWETKIGKVLSDIRYEKDTAIGNGLKAAVDLLDSQGRADADQAILLFSDGVDDLKSQLLYQEAQERLNDSILWTKNNGCPVYVIGFNYRLGDGKDSIGDQGLEKLQRIADSTDRGSLTVIQDLAGIRENVLKIIEAIWGIPMPPRQEFVLPRVEPINVMDGIVEMNISISGESKDALAGVDISLTDPNGREIDLGADDKIWFSRSDSMANIKMFSPMSGKWTLSLDGSDSAGRKIYAIIMENHLLTVDFAMKIPGNSDNMAYQGDQVKFSAVVRNQDGDPVSEAFYKDITSAEAIIRSRSDKSEKRVALTCEKGSGELAGIWVADGKSVCDAWISVSSPYFSEKSETFVINNGNTALELTDKIPDNVEIRVKKAVDVADIMQYVYDKEGDDITAEIRIDDPGVATAVINDDSLHIEGLKWGSTNASIIYTDAQGNSVERSFGIKVRDPVKVLLLTMIPALIAAIVAMVILAAAWNSRFIPGMFTVENVTVKRSGIDNRIAIPVELKAGKDVCRGSRSNFDQFMKKYTGRIYLEKKITAEQREALAALMQAGTNNPIRRAMRKAMFQGTPFGKKGFFLEVPPDPNIELDKNGTGAKVRQPFNGGETFSIRVGDPNGDQITVKIRYSKKIVSRPKGGDGSGKWGA